MDKMNMLNDEELEKVNGGGRMVWMEDDKLCVGDEMECNCEGSYYKGWVLGGIQMCRDCEYYDNGYCTNKEAWDFLLKVYGI